MRDVFHFSYNEAFKIDTTSSLSKIAKFPDGTVNCCFFRHQIKFRIINVIISKCFRRSNRCPECSKTINSFKCNFFVVLPSGFTPNTLTASLANRVRIHFNIMTHPMRE